MKKFAKMSLVAAVAVAGLTNVNAASLEEAIKGVDVSGQFRYRADEISSGTSTTQTDVEIEIVAKVPVNDNVTAIFKIDNGNDDVDGSIVKGPVEIEDYYFQYVNGALTVNAGQQNIPGRLTDGLQGDGIVALYNAGAFTVGGASFMNTNAAGSEMLNSVLAMGSFGPVSLSAQYATANDVVDTYNIKVDATVGPVKIGVEYTESEYETNAIAIAQGSLGAKDNSTLKAYVSGKIDIVSAALSYVKTDDNGSGSIDQDSDAASELLLWQVGSGSVAELDAFVIDASVAVTPKISLRAAYLDGEYGATDTDLSEVLGQISYKMSSNLNTYVRYSQMEDGTTETDRGRIEVKYSF